MASARPRYRGVLADRMMEFAVFEKATDEIDWHKHEDGHYSVLVLGKALCEIEGQPAVTLVEIGDKVYFPGGVRHHLRAVVDNTICLQVHDADRIT